MSDLPRNLMWTSADLERMSPEQVKRLTDAGELKHLLAGNELTQEEADALKREHAAEAGPAHDEEWLATASDAEIVEATRRGLLKDVLGGGAPA